MSGIVKIPVVVLWFLLVVAAPGWSVEVGEPLPDFALQTFDGSNLSRAALAGKPLLLIFWNTWCPNCMRELPRIDRLVETLGPRRLAVLAINTGINDTESKARTYWKKQGFRFPAGFDHDFEITQAFAIPGVPTIFLVDAKGVVRYKQALLPEDVEGRLEQLFP